MRPRRPVIRPHLQAVELTGEHWDFIADLLEERGSEWPDWACEIDRRVMTERLGQPLSRRANAERWRRSERFARVMAGGE